MPKENKPKKDTDKALQIIVQKAERCHLTLLELAKYIDSLSDWEIMAECEEMRED